MSINQRYAGPDEYFLTGAPAPRCNLKGRYFLDPPPYLGIQGVLELAQGPDLWHSRDGSDSRLIWIQKVTSYGE